MSTFEHVFIRTELSPEDMATQLAGLLDMRVGRDARGTVYLGRPVTGGASGEVGGQVAANRYAYPFDEPEEQSVIDGYELVWDIGYTGRDDEIQLAEARRLFTEMTAKAAWPAVLLHGLDLLLAAWSPGLGLRWFPAGTSPDLAGRVLWEPYRQAHRA